MTVTTNEVCKITTVPFHSINHISMAAMPASDVQTTLTVINHISTAAMPVSDV
jgi:hypothetical protein